LRTFLFLLAFLCGGFAHAQSSFPVQHPGHICQNGERWSVKFGTNTPAGVTPAAAGDFIHIKAGEVVLIDENTVDLAGLYIEAEGTLGFLENSGNPELRSAYILVAGDFLVGCRAPSGAVTEFSSKATITLIAPECYGATTSTPDFGVKWTTYASEADFGASGPVKDACLDRGLVVTGGGRLMIYGKDKGVSWTQLDATASVNDTQISLIDDPTGGWKDGDSVVIASTDFEYPDPAHLSGRFDGYQQGEVKVLSGHPAGTTVSLASALAYEHYGEDIGPPPTSPNMHSIPVRAEVGLLSRNVVIQGDESDVSAFHLPVSGLRHFGHVMLMDENPSDSLVPFCEVQWAEIRNLGVEATIRRYPFHWHELGDAYELTDRPFLKNCSIHSSVNRFLSVHHTEYVTVENNVGYDCQGIGFYLEDVATVAHPDYDRVRNVQLRDNLGLKVDRVPDTVTNNGIERCIFDIDQLEPSVFWVVNPENQVKGNHAAGAAGHGFYLQPQKGEEYSHTTANGFHFRDNVSHSNGQHGFYHNARPRWQYDEVAGDLPAAENLVAYKNRRFGVWWRTKGRAHLKGLRLADNKSGIYPASEGHQNAGDVLVPAGIDGVLTSYLSIDDVTIFGETDNVGTQNNPAETALGRSLPQTYFYFSRPDGTETFSAPLDTINGIECYDGLVEMKDFEIAYFKDAFDVPDPEGTIAKAFRPSGGITQVEYDSAYAEDPRNRLLDWEVDDGQLGTVDHPAYYRTPVAGASMVWNTVIVVEDNSLGYGTSAPTILSYQDLFFTANAAGAGTLFSSDQLFAHADANVDFAQFEVDDRDTGSATLMSVAVPDSGGVLRPLTGLKSKPSPSTGGRRWAFNAPLGISETQQTGIYYLQFSAGTSPTEYDITVQFAESAGLETVLCVPWTGGVPSSIKINSNAIGAVPFDRNGDTVIDERDLLHSTAGAHEYYWDGIDKLFIKTTAVLPWPWGGSADVEGTENVVHID